MKNLHIIPSEKFTKSYIEFINKNFNLEEHFFIIIGKSYSENFHQKNVIVLQRNFNDFFTLIKILNSSKKIFLHSLIFMNIIRIILLQPWLLKKCHWIIWGGDLYDYLKPRTNFKAKVKEFSRAYVIKRVGGLVTHVKGDYELAKEWYAVRGKYYYSFVYPSNLYKEISISKSEDNIVTYIQVGNSADPSNNHLEVFEKLYFLKPENIHIICPLSYGDKEYAGKIVKRGKEIFGDNFEPLLEFMPFDKYLEIISKTDIAIFNHNRQQAIGNITTLLGLGKKVYIRDDISTWEFCEEHGLKVFKANNNFEDLFELIDEKARINNMENVKKFFSEQKLKEDLNRIFS